MVWGARAARCVLVMDYMVDHKCYVIYIHWRKCRYIALYMTMAQQRILLSANRGVVFDES